MNDIDRIYSFLGLACKAGKVVSGDETSERTIKIGKAVLVIIAQDASDNTKKKFNDVCSYRGIESRVFGTKERLGKSIGKDTRSVVAVCDKEFSKRMIELIGDISVKGGDGSIGKN